MAGLDTTEAWNAYCDKFGYEPGDATQLQKFTKSSAGKHVQHLSFKDAREIFKMNKGKGRIGDDMNTPSSSRGRSPSPSPQLKPNKKRHRKSKSNLERPRNDKKSNSKRSSVTPTPSSNRSNDGFLDRKKRKSGSKSPLTSAPKRLSLKSMKSSSSSSSTSSTSSSKSTSSQLSPPNKSGHKKSTKHKKTGSNMSKKSKDSKKKQGKKKKEIKEREIRSKLNNDPNNNSLDSILEILRRATLVKKHNQISAEQKEREERELQDALNKENENEQQPENVKRSSLFMNDLTTTDLEEFRIKEKENNKETEDLFQTITSADGSVTNFNPLLRANGSNSKYSIDGDGNSSSDENGNDMDGDDGNNNNHNNVINGHVVTLNVIDDEKEDSLCITDEVEQEEKEKDKKEENDDDDDGYESPPEFFRDDNEWDWTVSDIVFKQSINYGISLHLLHLGLSQGPLFPNSILKWNRLSFRENAPTPRSGHVSAFINDKMVIFGGYCKQMLTDHIFIVDTNELDIDKPLEVTPISSLEKIHKTYRVGHCGVSLSHNNCLYLFGGWNDQQYINHGLLFNVDSLKLVVEQTKDRLLPPPRRDHTLCKMGPYLLLFGGWSHDYDGNELWLLGSNWKWQQLDVIGTAPCSRRGHSANVVGSHMFIFGGLYGFTKYLNDIHIYDGDNNEWIQPELVGINRPPQRAWHTANIIGQTQILYFGGTNGRTSFYNDCWVFDTCGYFWFQIECHGRSPLPRCSHTMIKIYQDKEFCNEPFTNECIKINKDGKIDGAQQRKTRLQLIMFGGLVAVDYDDDDDDEHKQKEDEIKNDKKGKKNKNKNKNKNKRISKKKQASNLLDEVKKNISKQQKKQKRNSKLIEKKRDSKRNSKLMKVEEDKNNDDNDDDNDEEKAKPKPIDVTLVNKDDDNKDDNDNIDDHIDDNNIDVIDDDKKEEDDDDDDDISSDSQQEYDMDHINRIELSDDLFVLMLEI